MQEFKGTPGPWVLLEAGDGITKKVPVDRGNTSILTIVEEDGVKFAAVMDGYDAQLIAAAPELLEALIMVRDADNDCAKDGLPTIPVSARGRIDRAIAKALNTDTTER